MYAFFYSPLLLIRLLLLCKSLHVTIISSAIVVTPKFLEADSDSCY
jgi:hypothetical protein